MSEKRSRGRPVGSSGKDDTKYLQQVADILLGSPKLKPTTAMRQVMNRHAGAWDANSDAAMLRRLQHKWKRDGVALIEAARVRAAHAHHDDMLANMGRLVTQYDAFMKKVASSEDVQRTLLAMGSMAEQAAKALEGPLGQLQSYVERNPDLLKALANASKNADRLTRLHHPVLLGPRSTR